MADKEATFLSSVEKGLRARPYARQRAGSPSKRRRGHRFNPEGSGFDEMAGARLRKEMPLTMAKPATKPAGPVPAESNEGAWEAWVWHPEENDWVVHGSSLDPHTGRLLKGINYSTINLTLEAEERLGNEIVKRKDGYYYSQKKKK